MNPPLHLTPVILNYLSSIGEQLGAINTSYLQVPRAELRKSNRIRTIQASLAIEGNNLTEEQVTAILENKKVLAPAKDIREVKNAIAVYEKINDWKVFSFPSFLKAHGLLMKGLIPSAGKLRTGGAGIIKAGGLAHLAPPAKLLGSLVRDLFSYLKNGDHPLLLKSCVFHYDIEFIHPFTDGNGRMGRLWQTLILMKYNPVFAYLPVESIIKKKQAAYYKALSNSDKAGECSEFVEFMLGAIAIALDEILEERQPVLTAQTRVELFQQKVGENNFSRKNYLEQYKNISRATASRDLRAAVEAGLLIIKGDKRTARYRFK